MSDLQGETSPTEQPTPEDSKDTHKTDFWTVATTLIIAFYFGWRMVDAMGSDVVRAQLLRLFIRMFSNMARYAGEQALLAEQLYYDAVRAMH